jgi:hypothetical protein
MSRATDAFALLATAMQDINPACQNDDRFISDDLPAATLSPICRACPLYAACAAYAGIERPKGGVWAGKRYKTSLLRKDNE